MKRQRWEEAISYAFALFFALAIMAVIILSLISSRGQNWNRETVVALVALLMLGIRGSMAWVWKMHLRSMLLILAFTEAVRPELSKTVADVRRQIIIEEPISRPVPSPGPSRVSPLTRESVHDAYQRLVVQVPSLLPKCELGATARVLFEEFFAEEKNRKDHG